MTLEGPLSWFSNKYLQNSDSKNNHRRHHHHLHSSFHVSLSLLPSSFNCLAPFFPLWLGFNPLSPNSVQHQFSPNNIHTQSRDKVMRINKMITIEKIPWSFIKFSQLILKVDVWRSVWRICMWILGLKGLTRLHFGGTVF